MAGSEAFRWRFFKNKQDTQTSDVFVMGGIDWAICIKQEPFRLCLELAQKNLPPGFTVRAKVSLTLVNELNRSESVVLSTDGHPVNFSGKNTAIAFNVPMPPAVLYRRGGGFCKDDETYIVEADVCVLQTVLQGSNFPSIGESSNTALKGQTVRESSKAVLKEQAAANVKFPVYSLATPKAVISETQERQGSAQLLDTPICAENMYNTLVTVTTQPTGDSSAEPPLATTLTNELVQFKDFGLIEKAFVPLLEEVYSFRPSMIECLRKGSPSVRLLALGALGQLLHFLKTTKGKDMTENACEHLKNLWDDVEMFRFDVTWLKPSVECALNMKKSVDRVRRVKRLRNDVQTYDKEIKKWSAALEAAKRDLVKEEEGLVEVDLDSELGYQMR